MRQCVGCREMKEKAGLIRVLRTDDGILVTDPAGKRNGRGAYLCPDLACLEKARKNHGLERSLKAVLPDGFYERLKEELDEPGRKDGDDCVNG